ncbi:MAG: GFA family protein [Candidatus Phaeomarinobacter sp.]
MQITRGKCHCGAVTFSLNVKPKALVDCNCSFCSRIRGLWAHCHVSEADIATGPHGTHAYSHGDRQLAFHSCKVCGCTTHWQGLTPENQDRLALNMRMADPKSIASIPIRKFDGAVTWSFID